VTTLEAKLLSTFFNKQFNAQVSKIARTEYKGLRIFWLGVRVEPLSPRPSPEDEIKDVQADGVLVDKEPVDFTSRPAADGGLNVIKPRFL
jgi:hypothetical protein